MLDELYLKGVVYDVEIFPNFLLIGFYSLRMKRYKQFIWYGEIDQREKMFEILLSRTLIGFNNWKFDDGVVNFLLDNRDNKNLTIYDVYLFAQNLIKSRKNIYQYQNNKLNYTYDVLELIRAGYKTTSLKYLGVLFKHDTVADLPYNYNEPILTSEQIHNLKKYNIEDLVLTTKGFEFCKSQLISRKFLSQHYGIDLYSISDSGLGKKIFEELYFQTLKQKGIKFNKNKIRYSKTERSEIHLKDVIYDNIQFRTPEMQEYLNHLKTLSLTREDLNMSVDKGEFEEHLDGIFEDEDE